MKNSSGMTKLRNKIVRSFIIVVFVVQVIDSVIDSIWDSLIAPGLYPNGEYAGIYDFGTISYMGASILLYVISAIIFYKIVKKAIEKESNRQVKEQNLVYAAIAHDLKTPMTSVQGFSKALAEGKIKPEETQEIYQIIYKKSNSMNELVNTLFEYAKYGTNEYKMNFSDTDLCVLVRDIIAENYCDLEEHGIEPEVHIPDDAIIIQADKHELKRAVSNLVINAYKHNPAGIKLLVKLTGDKNACTLVIADSGLEIAENMKVFEPFVTGNEARTVGKGTGLGLAITKKILDQHNARIAVSCEIEGYTKGFVVDFNGVDEISPFHILEIGH